MTTWLLFWSAWEWHPSELIGCFGLVAVYFGVVRPLRRRRCVAFVAGTLILLLTLAGPLDVLGDEYLFSMHMLEHLVFLEIVPPLLVLGLPQEAVDRLLRPSPLRFVERRLSRPWAAWMSGILPVYLWHLPTLYNAALADEQVHAMEHLSFLIGATVLWWPVIAPAPAHAMKPHHGMLYLGVAAVANSVLGAVLTFGSPGLYPWYTRPTGDSAALALIRDGWGIDPRSDLQLGGMYMWVVGGLFFLFAIMTVYARWYRHSGEAGIP